MIREVVDIEDVDAVRSPEQVADLYLSYSHDLPVFLPKTREFFEKILVETGSIKVSHKPRDRYNLAFSTVKILKVLRPCDWVGDLRTHKYFETKSMVPKYFNYFDYTLAWEKFLYYQNEHYTHSWFLHPKFPKTINVLDFPAWFQSWFYYWGPVPQFFPPKVEDMFDRYFQTSNGLYENQALLSFCCANEIPWIFKWSYTITQHAGTGVHRLCRQLAIKWWSKFDEDKIENIPPHVVDGDMGKYDASQQKLKSILKGIPKNEILDFLRNHDDTVTMLDSDDEKYDPFGGPCSQPK